MSKRCRCCQRIGFFLLKWRFSLTCLFGVSPTSASEESDEMPAMLSRECCQYRSLTMCIVAIRFSSCACAPFWANFSRLQLWRLINARATLVRLSLGYLSFPVANIDSWRLHGNSGLFVSEPSTKSLNKCRMPGMLRWPPSAFGCESHHCPQPPPCRSSQHPLS